MKFKRNLLILSVILIGILIVAAGCVPTTVDEEVEEEAEDAPTNGTISVAAGAATTNDTTPTLTLSSTGATYMAFSGDGVNWSDWVAYATTYSSFGVTTGEGCTSGDGTKIVYVKYKNDDDVESTKVYDSFYLDTAAPTLTTAAYTDTSSGGTVNAADTVVFTFSDEMLTTTVAASTVATVLPLSSSKSYGTSPTVAWDSTLKICTVTLGTSPTLVAGTTTVTPTAAVTDSAGNAYASTTAVTISGTTTAATVPSAITLAVGSATPVGGVTNVAIPAAGATNTTGAVTGWVTLTADMIKFTVTDGGSAASTITIGGAAYTSGANYTIPSTTSLSIVVTTTETGKTTCVRTFTVTVAAPAASTSPDADLLFVSACTDKAKYTSLASGYSVKVYSYSGNNADSAVAAGEKCTIEDEDTWITLSPAPGDEDYIFFELIQSGWTSDITPDGLIPEAPTDAALLEIEAINTTTIHSDTAGNLTTADSIRCYVDSAEYNSTAVNVETNMTVTALVAGDRPYYTKINTDGHESDYSSQDGEILILTDAVARNVTTDDSLVAGDTITLIYSGAVDVKLPIYVSHLKWTATETTASFGASSDTIKDADLANDSTEVLLTAVAPTDFADSAESITFNMPINVRIVDAAGGNFVLPWASDSAAHFDSADF